MSLSSKMLTKVIESENVTVLAVMLMLLMLKLNQGNMIRLLIDHVGAAVCSATSS